MVVGSWTVGGGGLGAEEGVCDVNYNLLEGEVGRERETQLMGKR